MLGGAQSQPSADQLCAIIGGAACFVRLRVSAHLVAVDVGVIVYDMPALAAT